MRSEAPRADARAVWTTFAFGALVIGAAQACAVLSSIDLLALLRPTPVALLAGFAATAPLAALLAWLMASRLQSIERFRRSQIEFFVNIGFRFTPFRNLMLAMVAGVGEELLFRGVFQTVADLALPTTIAIIAPNLLFGALHARTLLYAVVAGAVGIYLGALFWATDSLAAPIITHALYDFIALEWTRRRLTGTPR